MFGIINMYKKFKKFKNTIQSNLKLEFHNFKMFFLEKFTSIN